MGGRPALAYFVLLAAGVAVAPRAAAPGGAWLVAASVLALLGASALLRRNLVALALIPLGWQLGTAALRPPEAARAIPEEAVGRRVRVEGVLVQDAVARDGRTRLLLRVSEVERGGDRRPADERVAAYLSGETPRWPEGTRLRLSGKLERPHSFRNPGAWDFEASLRRQGVRFTLLGAASGARTLGALPGEDLGPLAAAVVGARTRIHDFLGGAAEGETAGVLKALILGDRLAFSDALYEKFQKTGTAHVLAISGMNLAIVGWLAYRSIKAAMKLWPPLLLRINIRKWATAAALAPILFYALITGPVVSAGRAAAMSVVFVAAVLLERENDPLSALGVAGLALVAARPLSLFSPSFQLSCAAVLAMIVFAPVILRGPPPDAAAMGRAERGARWAGRWVREMLLVSLVTELGTAPIIAAHFSRLTWVGPFANLVVIPLTGIVAAPLALVASVLSMASEPAAGLLLRPAVWAVDAAIAWIEWVDRLPGLSQPVPTPGPAAIVGAYLLIAAVAPPAKGRRALLAGAGAVVLAGAAAASILSGARAQGPTVTFLDFDRGEMAWIEGEDGRGVLVYGGVRGRSRFDAGRRVLFPFLAQRGVREIDDLVLPWERGRRALGVDFLAEQFDVARCWLPPRGAEPEGPPECAALDGTAPLRVAEGGDGLVWSAPDGAAVWFAGPLRKRAPRPPAGLAGDAALLLVQAEWEPRSRGFPPARLGAAALVVTGKSPPDACDAARSSGWIGPEAECGRTWEEGALEAERTRDGRWRLRPAPDA